MFPLIELCKQLISCRSITPNDAGCQLIIKERLKQLGFLCESMHFNNVDNLWAKLGANSPLIVFAGHTVVIVSLCFLGCVVMDIVYQAQVAIALLFMVCWPTTHHHLIAVLGNQATRYTWFGHLHF